MGGNKNPYGEPVDHIPLNGYVGAEATGRELAIGGFARPTEQPPGVDWNTHVQVQDSFDTYRKPDGSS